MLNFLYVGRLMAHPQGLGALPAFQVSGESILDTTHPDGRTHLNYDGNSQGGIIGGALAAVAVDHEKAVLGVPGMNYSTLLRRSVDFDAYAEGNFEGVETPLGMYDSYPNELERPLILSLIQLLWDRAEANGYAQHMTDDPLSEHARARRAAARRLRRPPGGGRVGRGGGAHDRRPHASPGARRRPAALLRPPGGREATCPGPACRRSGTRSTAPGWSSGTSGRCARRAARPTARPTAPARRRRRRATCRRASASTRTSSRAARPLARTQKSAFFDGSLIDVCSGGPCYAGDWTGPP